MKASEQGSDFAQKQYELISLQIAMKYYEANIREKKDIKKAVSWLKKAASVGNEYASVKLGVMYFEGKEIKKNEKKGKKILLDAIENGSELARGQLKVICCEVAMQCSKDGKDLFKGFEWLRLAKSLGSTIVDKQMLVIMWRVFLDFFENKASLDEMEKALECFDETKSILKVEMDESFYITFSLALGKYLESTEKDRAYIPLAFSLLKDHAKKGNQQACLYLAKAYVSGLGVEKDLDQAIFWANKGKRKSL